MIHRLRAREAVVVAAIALAVLLGLHAGCNREAESKQSGAAAPVKRLTIVTPHNPRIRQAFEMGFAEWYRAKRNGDVAIEWVTLGTPDCVRYIDAVLSGASSIPDRGQGRKVPDLLFGGGIADHEQLAALDYSLSLDLRSEIAPIPEQVNGQPTRDPGGRWWSTGLSSFGILYNAADCKARDIAPPATWDDLARPDLAGWVAVADPAQSGSHLQAMTMILQARGFEKGWATIMAILANARTLLASSSEASDAVNRGIFLAGFVVNFQGLALQEGSDGRLVYVNPAGATAATPDVISVLKSANDRGLATDFVRYCLSEDGQQVWSARQEQSGSNRPTLYHYPIVPAVYAALGSSLSVPENPFEIDLGVRVNVAEATAYNRLLPALVRAACGENHIALQRAWAALIAAGLPEDDVQALFAPPAGRDELLEQLNVLQGEDPQLAADVEQAWSQHFAARYATILAKRGGS